jgi:hypothetical protein
MNNLYDEDFQALVKEIVGDLEGINTSDPEFLAAIKNLMTHTLNKNKSKTRKNNENKNTNKNKKNNNNRTYKIKFSNNIVKVKEIPRMGPTQVVGEYVMEAPLPNNYPNRVKSQTIKKRKGRTLTQKEISKRINNTNKSNTASRAARELANAFKTYNTIYEVGEYIKRTRANTDPLTKLFVRKYGPRMQNYEDYAKFYQSNKYLNYKPNTPNNNLYS